MSRLVWTALIVLPLWASCGSTSGTSRFTEPNALMADEIRNRIAQIPYQHREELFHNLLWLAQAGEQAIPALLDGLQHNSPKLRSNAAWTLGQIGDRRVITDLKELAQDENPTVRLEVARTLVLLGDIQHCALLIDSLDSDQVEVRYLCHEALKSSTGQDFGYDHLSDNVMLRHSTVLAWREWWGEMSGDPWFAAGYARRHGLLEEPALPPDAMPEPDTSTPPTPPMPLIEVQTPRTNPMPEGPATTQPTVEPIVQPTVEPREPAIEEIGLEPDPVPTPVPSEVGPPSQPPVEEHIETGAEKATEHGTESQKSGNNGH